MRNVIPLNRGRKFSLNAVIDIYHYIDMVDYKNNLTDGKIYLFCLFEDFLH